MFNKTLNVRGYIKLKAPLSEIFDVGIGSGPYDVKGSLTAPDPLFGSQLPRMKSKKVSKCYPAPNGRELN